MNRKLAITISLLTLLCLGLVGQATAQSRVPGVKTGDTLVYSITSHWRADNASEPVPAWLAEYNQTSQYKVNVGLVSGVNVTTTQLWDFKNGTEYPYLVTVDVESGTPYYYTGTQTLFEGIVGANINAGSLLHPTGNDSVIVNQTITRTYAAGARDTNIVELTSPIKNQTTDPVTNATIYETIGSQRVTFYIDKETGILVEQQTVIDSLTPVETASITWNLKQTNLWDASPPSNTNLLIVVGVVVAVIVVAAVIIFRRDKKSRKPRR